MTIVRSVLDGEQVLLETLEGHYLDLAADLMLEIGPRMSEVIVSSDRDNQRMLIVANGLSVEYRAA